MPVVAVEFGERQPYADGRTFAAAGAYERVEAQVTFAVDPTHHANEGIVDLGLAETDRSGRVRFTSDLLVLRPIDPTNGSRRVLVEAVNRGQPLSPRVLDRAPYEGPDGVDVQPGDGFLFRHGFAMAYVGWQWDVRRAGGLLGFDAPEARIDGVAIEGDTVVEIRPTWRTRTRLLANRTHRAYPAADVDQSDAVLTVREWEDGPVEVVPRSAWSFARETEGGVVPSSEHVHLPQGFEPGRQYHVIYRTVGAPVVGTGLLAFREIATFLRSDDPSNPLAGRVDRVHGFGMSQSGRFLRHFLYLGLNVAEDGSHAYDGLVPHVAGGRRGEFNHRFAQPSVQLLPTFGHLPPFADDPRPDPYSGRIAGLLDRQRERGHVPRVIHLNTAAEYWRGDGWLVHADPTGTEDLHLPEEVRAYALAGTQHFPGEVPQVDFNPHDGARGRYGFNTVEFTPLVRAALLNLDRWCAAGEPPPPSRIPTLGSGTAVTRQEVLDELRELTDRPLPDPARLPVLREVDLGPRAGEGVARHPVPEGRGYPCRVSAIDADGNERAGIRLPDVTVPLATHLGFNPRHPVTGGEDQIMSMQGASWYFARTEQERRANDDPRPSLEERYGDRGGYLDRVRTEALRLVEARYLLAEDVEVVVEDAARRWEHAQAGAPVDESPWLAACRARGLEPAGRSST